MIFVLQLNKEEVELLKDYFKKGPNTLVRARAQTILLSGNRERVPRIAQIVFYSAPVVREWVNAWNSRRMSSIFPEYVGNQNAAKLTRKQKKEVEEILNKTPSDYDIPGSFWTLPDIKNHIHSTFGVVYETKRSYHLLLRHCGYSWKLPSPFDRKRDDTYVSKRIEEIRTEVESYMKDDDWIVLTEDEARINWEEETRRAWLKRGQKTVIKLERNKSNYQNYAGFLNQKTGKHHLVELEWQNTENIIPALLKISKQYPNKRICIIWDQASWHKSQELRDVLKKGEPLSHLHLILLPPYAPDENPQEKVWNYGKKAIANTHFETFEELKKAFKKAITSRTFDYKL